MAKYLLDNPSQLRSEVKNGVTHYLVRIDADGQPMFRVTRNDIDTQKNRASGQLIKADTLYPGGSVGVSITGTGMVAGVWEPSGVRASHELFAGKAANQTGQVEGATAGDRNHAAHVTGTVIGVDLASRPTARGIAFGASSQNWDAANDLTEMTTFAAGGFLISNHSYGDANTQTANVWKYGAYDAESRGWDEVTKNAPFYLPFVAGGNEQQANGNPTKMGYDIMTGSSAAKNIMTVGAVNGDKTMSDYSNWGPTDDGRVKPDIVAKGTGIDSAQSNTADGTLVCDNCYSGSGVGSSGTSYSTPASAAAGLLLQQYYKSLHGVYMRSSTLKALMMGTAEDLGATGPDHKFGWGLLNVENAALTIKRRSPLAATLATSKGAYIEEIATNPAANSTAEITRDVFAKGGVPMVVNIGWVDDDGPEQLAAEGIDPTTTRLVYDFDMMVRQVAPNPVVDTWPWVVPGMANRTANATVATAWFQSNGGNFRQIIIPTPIANARYTVTLRKKTGSPALDRSVSLVVTGLADSCDTHVGGTTCNLDADGNGLFEPRDAQLIVRRMTGLSDAALTDGLTAPLACATRQTGASVATFVDARGSGAALPKPYDIDGDGKVLATTDGLMMLRVALGLTGDAVVLNATAPGAPRTTWAQVRPYLVTECGFTVG